MPSKSYKNLSLRSVEKDIQFKEESGLTVRSHTIDNGYCGESWTTRWEQMTGIKPPVEGKRSRAKGRGYHLRKHQNQYYLPFDGTDAPRTPVQRSHNGRPNRSEL